MDHTQLNPFVPQASIHRYSNGIFELHVYLSGTASEVQIIPHADRLIVSGRIYPHARRYGTLVWTDHPCGWFGKDIPLKLSSGTECVILEKKQIHGSYVITYVLRNSQSSKHSVYFDRASDSCANTPSLQIPSQEIDVHHHHGQRQPPSQNHLPSEYFPPHSQHDCSYGSGLIADNYVTFQAGEIGIARHGYPASPQGQMQATPRRYTADGEDSYGGVWFDASFQGAQGSTSVVEAQGSHRTEIVDRGHTAATSVVTASTVVHGGTTIATDGGVGTTQTVATAVANGSFSGGNSSLVSHTRADLAISGGAQTTVIDATGGHEVAGSDVGSRRSQEAKIIIRESHEYTGITGSSRAVETIQGGSTSVSGGGGAIYQEPGARSHGVLVLDSRSSDDTHTLRRSGAEVSLSSVHDMEAHRHSASLISRETESGVSGLGQNQSTKIVRFDLEGAETHTDVTVLDGSAVLGRGQQLPVGMMESHGGALQNVEGYPGDVTRRVAQLDASEGPHAGTSVGNNLAGKVSGREQERTEGRQSESTKLSQENWQAESVHIVQQEGGVHTEMASGAGPSQGLQETFEQGCQSITITAPIQSHYPINSVGESQHPAMLIPGRGSAHATEISANVDFATRQDQHGQNAVFVGHDQEHFQNEFLTGGIPSGYMGGNAVHVVGGTQSGFAGGRLNQGDSGAGSNTSTVVPFSEQIPQKTGYEPLSGTGMDASAVAGGDQTIYPSGLIPPSGPRLSNVVQPPAGAGEDPGLYATGYPTGSTHALSGNVTSTVVAQSEQSSYAVGSSLGSSHIDAGANVNAPPAGNLPITTGVYEPGIGGFVESGEERREEGGVASGVSADQASYPGGFNPVVITRPTPQTPGFTSQQPQQHHGYASEYYNAPMANDSTTGVERDVINRPKMISGSSADDRVRQGATGSMTNVTIGIAQVQDRRGESVQFSRTESSSSATDFIGDEPFVSRRAEALPTSSAVNDQLLNAGVLVGTQDPFADTHRAPPGAADELSIRCQSARVEEPEQSTVAVSRHASAASDCVADVLETNVPVSEEKGGRLGKQGSNAAKSVDFCAEELTTSIPASVSRSNFSSATHLGDTEVGTAMSAAQGVSVVVSEYQGSTASYLQSQAMEESRLPTGFVTDATGSTDTAASVEQTTRASPLKQRTSVERTSEAVTPGQQSGEAQRFGLEHATEGTTLSTEELENFSRTKKVRFNDIASTAGHTPFVPPYSLPDSDIGTSGTPIMTSTNPGGFVSPTADIAGPRDNGGALEQVQRTSISRTSSSSSTHTSIQEQMSASRRAASEGRAGTASANPNQMHVQDDAVAIRGATGTAVTPTVVDEGATALHAGGSRTEYVNSGLSGAAQSSMSNVEVRLHEAASTPIIVFDHANAEEAHQNVSVTDDQSTSENHTGMHGNEKLKMDVSEEYEQNTGTLDNAVSHTVEGDTTGEASTSEAFGRVLGVVLRRLVEKPNSSSQQAAERATDIATINRTQVDSQKDDVEVSNSHSGFSGVTTPEVTNAPDMFPGDATDKSSDSARDEANMSESWTQVSHPHVEAFAVSSQRDSGTISTPIENTAAIPSEEATTQTQRNRETSEQSSSSFATLDKMTYMESSTSLGSCSSTEILGSHTTAGTMSDSNATTTAHSMEQQANRVQQTARQWVDSQDNKTDGAISVAASETTSTATSDSTSISEQEQMLIAMDTGSARALNVENNGRITEPVAPQLAETAAEEKFSVEQGSQELREMSNEDEISLTTRTIAPGATTVETSEGHLVAPEHLLGVCMGTCMGCGYESLAQDTGLGEADIQPQSNNNDYASPKSDIGKLSKITPKEVAAVRKVESSVNDRQTANGNLGGIELESEPDPSQSGSRAHTDLMGALSHHSESFLSSSHSEATAFTKTLEVNSPAMVSQGLGTSIQRITSPSLINSRDSLSYADIVASRRPGGAVSPTPSQIPLESMQGETWEQKKLTDENALLSEPSCTPASGIPLPVQARATSPTNPPNIRYHHDSGHPTNESSDASDDASEGKGKGRAFIQEASPNPSVELQPQESQSFRAQEPS